MEPHVLDKYNSPYGAKRYEGKFTRHWNERLNNRWEQRLLARLLGGLEKSDLGLDMPCGYGRLSRAIQAKADRVVASDWSFYLLQGARDHLTPNGSAGGPAGFVRVSAIHLPFPGRAFGLVLSVRLCHHLSTHEERMQYVGEILRVSSRYVVFTYFDTDSLKNRVHRAKRRFVRKREKYTLCRTDVARAAEESGFRVVKSVPLSRLFSGHCYAVLERRD